MTRQMFSWKSTVNNSSAVGSRLWRKAGRSAFQLQETMLKSDEIWCTVHMLWSTVWVQEYMLWLDACLPLLCRNGWIDPHWAPNFVYITRWPWCRATVGTNSINNTFFYLYYLVETCYCVSLLTRCCCANAIIAITLCLSVRLSVTSRRSVKTTALINLDFGTNRGGSIGGTGARAPPPKPETFKYLKIQFSSILLQSC